MDASTRAPKRIEVTLPSGRKPTATPSSRPWCGPAPTRCRSRRRRRWPVHWRRADRPASCSDSVRLADFTSAFETLRLARCVVSRPPAGLVDSRVGRRFIASSPPPAAGRSSRRARFTSVAFMPLGLALASMQTTFTLAQLADPDIAEADKILRACVHCGFCTATCPTYVLLGDELDSPARAHLPDQGHAGARPAGDRRGGQAYRPLPVLPGLHDHLSVGRALHAPRRSCPRAYRGDLPAAAGSTACCARCWRACCPIRAASALALDRRPGSASRSPALLAALGLARARRHAAAGAGAAPPPAPRRRGGVFPAEGHAAGRVALLTAASARCWRPRSTRPPSACSPATASRWWWPKARAAAARSSITWAASRRRCAARAPISTPGRARSRARGSTPS